MNINMEIGNEDRMEAYAVRQVRKNERQYFLFFIRVMLNLLLY